MALVGYVRVSAVGQSLEVHLEKLKHCSKLFQEKKSGIDAKRSIPKQLQKLVLGNAKAFGILRS